MVVDMVNFGLIYYCCLFDLFFFVLFDGKLRLEKESLMEFSLLLSEVTMIDVVFKELCFISDWVFFFVGKC